MNQPKEMRELQVGGVKYETQLTVKFERRRPYAPADPRYVRCVIPGVIQLIHVHHGTRVEEGAPLLVLEAMKMQNEILSPRKALVRKVCVQSGDVVSKGQILIELE
ncbi:MAG TPA: acetyl-CoA carboxylase biotin carboxyl carrier protein subunit [Bacteroidota bacterium]|nr:acetyl-CoA carboxylase biotin carboxyl carrier protein subunit [Bacteroidota bacterium]